MTITKVNASGWSSGAKLTSTQANSFDTKIVTALDKTSAGDTLSGVINCSGEGRIRPSYVVGSNSDTSYTLSSGISIIDVKAASLTANRSYTLNTSGAAAGDLVDVLGHATYGVTVNSLLTIGGANGTASWARFLYNGSAWVLLASNQEAPLIRSGGFWPTLWTGATEGSLTATAGDQSGNPFTDVGNIGLFTGLSSDGTTMHNFDDYGGGAWFRVLPGEVITGSSTSYIWFMPINHLLIHGRTLSSVRVSYWAANAPVHAGLPALKPGIHIRQFGSFSTGTNAAGAALLSTNNGWAVDPSASAAAFDSGAHDIIFTPDQNNVIDLSDSGGYGYKYVLALNVEGGTNALDGSPVGKMIGRVLCTHT